MGNGKQPAAAHPLVTRHHLKEQRQSLKILLAEDEPINQILAQAILEEKNYLITVADNGAQALEFLKSDNFDLILMDVQMPVMDGIEATKKIRENEKTTGSHVPIIALTAFAVKGDKEAFLAAGMDDYLSKPFVSKELFDVIDKYRP